MKILFLINIFLISHLLVVCVTSSSPPLCKNINQTALILNTLNGKVKGLCYNKPIYYASKSTSTNNPVLNWLGIPYAEAPGKY